MADCFFPAGHVAIQLGLALGHWLRQLSPRRKWNRDIDAGMEKRFPEPSVASQLLAASRERLALETGHLECRSCESKQSNQQRNESERYELE